MMQSHIDCEKDKQSLIAACEPFNLFITVMMLVVVGENKILIKRKD